MSIQPEAPPPEGPAAPPPDLKDWTWVLERPCPDCGFDASTCSFGAIPQLTIDTAGRWLTVLQRPDAPARPERDVWSPLEYACHVRDVFRLFDERLALMLDEDAPRFANWDQDETAVNDRYHEQDPAVVAEQLAEAATTISRSFQAVTPDQLDRTGTRSDGAHFTIETFGRYFIHDPLHHLWDVGG